MTSKPESVVALPIGHSTCTVEEFVRLLQAHAVTRVIDVRTVPRSRHNPQFNRDTLPASLKTTAIGYTHMRNLAVCVERLAILFSFLRAREIYRNLARYVRRNTGSRLEGF